MSLLDIIPDIAVHIAPDYMSNLALRMTCKLYYNTIPSINLHPFDISWIPLTRKKCKHNKCKSITYIESVILTLSPTIITPTPCAKHILQNIFRKNDKIKFDHIPHYDFAPYYRLMLGRYNSDLFWWLMHLGVLPLHQDEVADSSNDHSIMDYMFEGNGVSEYTSDSVVVPYIYEILKKYIKRTTDDLFSYGDYLIKLRIPEYKLLKSYLANEEYANVPFIRSIYYLWDDHNNDHDELEGLWNKCGRLLQDIIKDQMYTDIPVYMDSDDDYWGF